MERNMEGIEFVSGTSVEFDDKAYRDGTNVDIRFTKYFENGQAVYITLDHREVKMLLDRLKEFKFN